MDEPADQFFKQVRLLSLINADIAYLPQEREFYFDKVIQPVTYSFVFGDAKFLVEWVAHFKKRLVKVKTL